MNILQAMLQFIRDPYNDFAGHTRDFLIICLVSIVVAIGIGVVLGVLVARQPALAFIASNFTGLARSIPPIAFVAAAIPILGIGFKPSSIALSVLGIPPILLNTVAGLQGIDPAIEDAARGMGMTRLQMLWRVQIPLILPVILAGVRTSVVQIIATAPLVAFFGAGGYGDYIIAGIGLQRQSILLVGTLPVIILALAAEFGLAALQRALSAQRIDTTPVLAAPPQLPQTLAGV